MHINEKIAYSLGMSDSLTCPDESLYRVDCEELIAIDDLIAGIVNELTNPLSSILGYTQILQTAECDSQTQRYINNIHISALKSARIIESLLIFLRKEEINKEEVNINDIIKNTVSLFEYQMKKKGIALRLVLDTDIPKIKGDYYKLQQAFFNILMNAQQALLLWDKEKRITLTTTFVKDHVRVTVSDTGPGVKREHFHKIFLPFFSTKGEGAGLGLSIVHGIIRDHGGAISLAQEQRGCTFVLEFSPMRDESAFTQEQRDNGTPQ